MRVRQDVVPKQRPPSASCDRYASTIPDADAMLCEETLSIASFSGAIWQVKLGYQKGMGV